MKSADPVEIWYRCLQRFGEDVNHSATIWHTFCRVKRRSGLPDDARICHLVREIASGTAPVVSSQEGARVGKSGVPSNVDRESPRRFFG